MNVKELLNSKELILQNDQGDLSREIDGLFTCDLLSHVMGFAKEGNIFITILNNINVLGVASLLDLSCVIFTHNISIKQEIIDKANELEIPLFKTKMSSADTAIYLNSIGVTN